MSDDPGFALRSLVADWREIANNNDEYTRSFRAGLAICAVELEQLIRVLYG